MTDGLLSRDLFTIFLTEKQLRKLEAIKHKRAEKMENRIATHERKYYGKTTK